MARGSFVCNASIVGSEGGLLKVIFLRLVWVHAMERFICL